METTFTPAALYAHDDSFINKVGNRVGVFRITDSPESCGKWIGEVPPYGKETGNFPEHEEAKAYAQLFAAAPDMAKAIELALNIKDLWAPAGDPSGEHEGEAQALQSMLTYLEAAYLKATGK
jgi:hypothetical protein